MSRGGPDGPTERGVESWPAGRGTLGLALVPFEAAYRLASGAYHAAYDAGRLRVHRAELPVVSVGNLLVGGAGKTPVARWLVQALLRHGAQPAVLHGGYGDDEPALHRRWHPDVPVYVGRDRASSAASAAADGRTVLVLDDGFQHRRLARDLDLVLVPAENWTARPRLLPRGPWREPPTALGRADVIAVTRKVAGVERARAVADAAAGFAPDADRVRIALRPGAWRSSGAREPGESTTTPSAGPTSPPGETLAVAGVARPEAFVANALDTGVVVGDVLRYPDHHRYTDEDAARIRRRAAGRAVVTTEKDAIKLERLAPDLTLWVLEQEVVVEAGTDALQRRMAALVG